MKDFKDRQPTQVGRRKITHADGTSEYVTVEMADEPTREGTPLNREAFMAVQGFEENETVFNEDGSITETNAQGEQMKTVFNADGTIDEIFTNKDGLKIGKRTTFNADGSISETLIDFATEEE